ncbi:MAG: beta-N-acetylhexosaminidase [Lachnospiraceae bacterium]|nr:beta-N-acetylhexosaminidase [Lachnospiraceae bacterium]
MNRFRLMTDAGDEAEVLKELLAENSHVLTEGNDGIPVRLEKTELTDAPEACLSVDTEGILLRYNCRSALSRAASLLMRYAGEKEGFSVCEKASFETVGPMLDCSRNAVPKPEKLKQLIRISALFGCNAIMLYTEDTYEIPGSPYFGRSRGRYSQEELRELDAYAARFGVELIPCIQMLAHLGAIFEWPPYRGMTDWDDILNLADERSYQLIEEMAKTISETYRTRKVNIGMDEAYLLGRGRYMEKYGYRKSAEIMREHLARVMEIMRKEGLEPRMWSDMFFRMCTPDESYYNPDFTLNEAARAAIPPEMTLVYWDYYGTERGRYDYMMKNHFSLTEKIAFAGGASCWYGVVPLNRFSLNSARAALASARDNGMQEVYVTMWGDDGGTCSAFSTLPTLACYGEANWNGRTDDENLAAALKYGSGADLEAFLNFEELENFGCRNDFGYAAKNPTRYLFWQDILQGKFDCHVPEDAEARYTQAIFRLMDDRQKCHPKYGYLFDTFSALSDALRLKAGLGKALKAAYDAGDRDALKMIADETLPELEKRIKAFRKVLRTQWMTDNKPFGFDLQDIRLGALSMRVTEAQEQLHEYLEGKISAIPELEEERLPYEEIPEDGDVTLAQNCWKRLATSSAFPVYY